MKRYFEKWEFDGWVKDGDIYYFNSSDGSKELPDISGTPNVIEGAKRFSEEMYFAFSYPSIKGSDRFQCWDPSMVEYETIAAGVYKKLPNGMFTCCEGKIHTDLVPSERMVRAARTAKEAFFRWRGIPVK